MSLQEAGYGSEEGQLGSEISGAVSGVTTPGASRLQASQSQERSTTMQRLQEDAHQVDPLETDHRAGEDPLDRADPAEALLEDPLETPTTHQGTATRVPPGVGLSTSAGGSSSSSAR